MDASEDSVWHYDPLLWQNGGSILSEDDTQAAFNSPEGVEALEVLTAMAVEDESVFLDIQNSAYTGHLQQRPDRDAHDRPVGPVELPGRGLRGGDPPGFDGDHQTIAGPDMWSVFDNGGGRKEAALEFLTVADRARADPEGGPRDRPPADPPLGRGGRGVPRGLRLGMSPASTSSPRT